MKSSARPLWLIPAAGLFLYSITLLWIEATTSQDYVRRYFTDIGQPEKAGYFAAPDGLTTFYAVNTSLSAFLLGAAGILLLFAAFADARNWSRQALLYAAQGALFLWMAADERFMLHERIGAAIGVRSTLVLAAAVLINAVLYAALFRPSYFSGRMVRRLIAGAGLFLVMMIFDLLLPHAMPLRLSLEDLAKTWAGFAFLLFAWEGARFRLIGQAQGDESMVLPEYLVSRAPRSWRSHQAS